MWFCGILMWFWDIPMWFCGLPMYFCGIPVWFVVSLCDFVVSLCNFVASLCDLWYPYVILWSPVCDFVANSKKICEEICSPSFSEKCWCQHFCWDSRLIFLRGPNLTQKLLYRHPVLKRESYLLISAIRATSRKWKTTHKVIEKDTPTIADHKDLHC